LRLGGSASRTDIYDVGWAAAVDAVSPGKGTIWTRWPGPPAPALGGALCITIIGIPLGLASFKIIPVSLVPLGVQIVPADEPAPSYT
jgi:hypothetical protein